MGRGRVARGGGGGWGCRSRPPPLGQSKDAPPWAIEGRRPRPRAPPTIPSLYLLQVRFTPKFPLFSPVFPATVTDYCTLSALITPINAASSAPISPEVSLADSLSRSWPHLISALICAAAGTVLSCPRRHSSRTSPSSEYSATPPAHTGTSPGPRSPPSFSIKSS